MTAKKPSKKALYESFVGQKYAYGDETYAVGRVLDGDFAVVSVSNGYGEHYSRVPCADFVKEASVLQASSPTKCEGMGCKAVSGYLTGFDGSDLCPSCLLTMVSETCEDCGALEDGESAAFVGNYVFCRDCYNGKDEEELAQLREE